MSVSAKTLALMSSLAVVKPCCMATFAEMMVPLTAATASTIPSTIAAVPVAIKAASSAYTRQIHIQRCMAMKLQNSKFFAGSPEVPASRLHPCCGSIGRNICWSTARHSLWLTSAARHIVFACSYALRLAWVRQAHQGAGFWQPLHAACLWHEGTKLIVWFRVPWILSTKGRTKGTGKLG